MVADASHPLRGVCIDGSRLAEFRPLFREHFRFVCVTLRRLGVREGDVEDVAQEVFVVVHRKLDSYDPADPARLWLFAICLRTASAYRRLARHRRQVQQDPEREVADSDPLADDLIAREQSRRLVLTALDSIELERRAVFVMHDLEEFSANQISETLSVPVNTVYSRLRRAREEFRKAIQRLRAAGDSR
nr:sigma-70 family RNA polymerase sigma factor [Labilithrix luteola]